MMLQLITGHLKGSAWSQKQHGQGIGNKSAERNNSRTFSQKRLLSWTIDREIDKTSVDIGACGERTAYRLLELQSPAENEQRR
jgi:hypothetical protein